MIRLPRFVQDDQHQLGFGIVSVLMAAEKISPMPKRGVFAAQFGRAILRTLQLATIATCLPKDRFDLDSQ
jgi:hypothetical protein